MSSITPLFLSLLSLFLVPSIADIRVLKAKALSNHHQRASKSTRSLQALIEQNAAKSCACCIAQNTMKPKLRGSLSLRKSPSGSAISLSPPAQTILLSLIFAAHWRWSVDEERMPQVSLRVTLLLGSHLTGCSFDVFRQQPRRNYSPPCFVDWLGHKF